MFHCLVIKVCCVCLSDSSFILSHLFLFVKHFFKFFSNIFELRFCCRFVGDFDTLSYLLSFVNNFLFFLKDDIVIIFQKQFVPNNSIRISSFQIAVNIFFTKNPFFPKKCVFQPKTALRRHDFPGNPVGSCLQNAVYSCKDSYKDIFVVEKV